jgi:ABC-type proline/glycine betaine transport system ATPase subunit
MDIPAGDYVRAFIASSDLTTAAAVTFLDKDGNTRVIAAGERVVLTDIAINNGGTASIVQVFQDQNNDGAVTAGDELYAANLAANSQNSVPFATPIFSLRKSATAANGKIKVIASAASANTKIVLIGFVLNS